MEIENSLNRLQVIAEKLNDRSISFDESVKFFEEGLKISKDCMQKLQKQKGKVMIIKKEMDQFIEETFQEEM